MRSRSILSLALLACLSSCAPLAPAFAGPPAPAWLEAFGAFCGRHEGYCKKRAVETLSIDDALEARIRQANEAVNARVQPMSDLAQFGRVEHWEFAALAGDCEDFALEKQRIMASFLPPSMLRLAKGRVPNTDGAMIGHAVLLVVGSNRTLLLDNLSSEVAIERSSVVLERRQSAVDPRVWESVS